jgi:hypothetical protein
LRSLSYNTKDTDWKNAEIEGKSTFNGSLFLGMDFGAWSLQGEVLLTGDNGTLNVPGIDGITGWSLLIPFIFKGDFRLGPVILQPLVGPYLNFVLGDLELGGTMGGKEPYANPPLGLMIGADAGIRLGGGIIFLDARFAVDLGKTAVGNNPMTAWSRSAFMLNLGYQFSLGRKT